MRLADKVAVITGAASGIGRESAYLFAKEGARIVVADIDDTGGEETAADIKANGNDSIFIHTDVSAAPEVEKLMEVIKDSFGTIDILLNSAGIFMKEAAFEEIQEAFWDRIFAINVKGTYLVIKYALPLLKKGGGVIVNMASIAGISPKANLAPYASSKGAIITLTKALARELGPYNIRVNCLCPTLTETPMIDVVPEKDKQACINFTPLGRLAKPGDVANAALYLASSESSMLTGVALNIDGGSGI